MNEAGLYVIYGFFAFVAIAIGLWDYLASRQARRRRGL